MTTATYGGVSMAELGAMPFARYERIRGVINRMNERATSDGGIPGGEGVDAG